MTGTVSAFRSIEIIHSVIAMLIKNAQARP